MVIDRFERNDDKNKSIWKIIQYSFGAIPVHVKSKTAGEVLYGPDGDETSETPPFENLDRQEQEHIIGANDGVIRAIEDRDPDQLTEMVSHVNTISQSFPRAKAYLSQDAQNARDAFQSEFEAREGEAKNRRREAFPDNDRARDSNFPLSLKATETADLARQAAATVLGRTVKIGAETRGENLHPQIPEQSDPSANGPGENRSRTQMEGQTNKEMSNSECLVYQGELRRLVEKRRRIHDDWFRLTERIGYLKGRIESLRNDIRIARDAQSLPWPPGPGVAASVAGGLTVDDRQREIEKLQIELHNAEIELDAINQTRQWLEEEEGRKRAYMRENGCEAL